VWDILFAVDASSSMADSHKSESGTSFVKIALVTQTIANLLNGGELPYGSRLGVMTFQAPTRMGGMFLAGSKEMTKVVVPLTPIGEMTRGWFEGRLATIAVSGATPSGIAIEEGLKVIYAAQDGPVRRIKKLVMITDERSNVGPRPEKVVDDEVAARAIIDVIAIGGKVNRETLEKVAAKTGGKFMVVESAEELLAAMKPRIDVPGLGVDQGLLSDVKRAELELERGRALGTGSMEYRQALEGARGVRARANKRLMEVMMLRAQADSDVRVLASQLEKGMPMVDYARRVWPRASELDQAEKVEKELRAAMERLAA
jgi:hypothetical protein